MNIDRLNRSFGREAKNRIDQTKERGLDGAIACLETFYYSFNNKDMDVFKKIWLNHELVQLNNPLGGIMRGISTIIEIYDRIFNGQAKVWVELGDIVYYQSNDTVTFAGREIGEFSINGETLDLQIRTTRFLGYSKTENRWFQIHHHGSIDNVDLLDRYQKAIKK